MGLFENVHNTQLADPASLALNQWTGAFGQQPLIRPIAPFWNGMAKVTPNAKPRLIANLPVHGSGLVPYDGRHVFHGRDTLKLYHTRGAWTSGASINVMEAVNLDLTSWTAHPRTIATEIGNNPSLAMVALLNGCYSGTPQDAAGNPITSRGLLPCRDQIYGGGNEYTAAVSNVNTPAIKSNGTLKHVNPLDSLSSTWYNCHENISTDTPAQYVAILENIAERASHNNVPLGLAEKQLRLLVAPGRYERHRILFTVMQQLVGSGVIGQVEFTPTGGDPMVAFGSQPNPVFGRLKVETVPGLRPDLSVIVMQGPDATPEWLPFWYCHGGTNGSLAIQENPMAEGTNMPHIFVQEWGPQSPMYFGTPEIPPFTIGVSTIVSEGFCWQSGLLMEFLFTGAAS